jgi:3,4-dihydroxy 2-butanone 4-phosphate synthase / GTP cyclohydrolase II
VDVPFATIPEAIEEYKRGNFVIIVDDEDRENEGDLAIAAEHVSPDAINFMAKYGRGLICVPIVGQRLEDLEVPMMVESNTSSYGTAFTVAVDARKGVSTGISAADRAATVRALIDPSTQPADLSRPGHVFPLRYAEGGVLRRTGQTEASVDLAKLAGLYPAAVICEIMNDDGTMARLPDLVAFAQRHGLKVGTIADLIAYRLTNDRLVEREIATDFHSRFGGDFRLQVYVNVLDGVEHVALVKGDVTTAEPVLVRVHAVNMLEDLLGEGESGRGDQLHRAMELIGAAGRGVIVILREPAPDGISQRIRISLGHQPDKPRDLRVYGIGAQILSDLGVKSMVLLSNTGRTIVGLEGYGLSVVETRPITMPGDR